MMSNRPSDVIYMTMPLYHASALALGMGMAFGFGNKTIVRNKFSATNFFKDCAKYNVTVSIKRETVHCSFVNIPFSQQSTSGKCVATC